MTSSHALGPPGRFYSHFAALQQNLLILQEINPRVGYPESTLCVIAMRSTLCSSDESQGRRFSEGVFARTAGTDELL